MNEERKVYCRGCGMKSTVELSDQIINIDCSCGMNTSYKPHGERRVKERRMTVIDYAHMSQIERRFKERRMAVIDYDRMSRIDRRTGDRVLAA